MTEAEYDSASFVPGIQAHSIGTPEVYRTVAFRVPGVDVGSEYDALAVI